LIVSDPGDGEPLELGVLLSLLHLGEELQDAGELLALLNGEEQLVLDSAADDVLLAGLLEQAGLEAREEDVGLTEAGAGTPRRRQAARRRRTATAARRRRPGTRRTGR